MAAVTVSTATSSLSSPSSSTKSSDGAAGVTNPNGSSSVRLVKFGLLDNDEDGDEKKSPLVTYFAEPKFVYGRGIIHQQDDGQRFKGWCHLPDIIHLLILNNYLYSFDIAHLMVLSHNERHRMLHYLSTTTMLRQDMETSAMDHLGMMIRYTKRLTCIDVNLKWEPRSSYPLLCDAVETNSSTLQQVGEKSVWDRNLLASLAKCSRLRILKLPFESIRGYDLPEGVWNVLQSCPLLHTFHCHLELWNYYWDFVGLSKLFPMPPFCLHSYLTTRCHTDRAWEDVSMTIPTGPESFLFGSASFTTLTHLHLRIRKPHVNMAIEINQLTALIILQLDHLEIPESCNGEALTWTLPSLEILQIDHCCLYLPRLKCRQLRELSVGIQWWRVTPNVQPQHQIVGWTKGSNGVINPLTNALIDVPLLSTLSCRLLSRYGYDGVFPFGLSSIWSTTPVLRHLRLHGPWFPSRIWYTNSLTMWPYLEVMSCDHFSFDNLEWQAEMNKRVPSTLPSSEPIKFQFHCY
jgi:hypothetical protein